MKRFYLSLLILAILVALPSCSKRANEEPSIKEADPIESRIESLLRATEEAIEKNDSSVSLIMRSENKELKRALDYNGYTFKGARAIESSDGSTTTIYSVRLNDGRHNREIGLSLINGEDEIATIDGKTYSEATLGEQDRAIVSAMLSLFEDEKVKNAFISYENLSYSFNNTNSLGIIINGRVDKLYSPENDNYTYSYSLRTAEDEITSIIDLSFSVNRDKNGGLEVVPLSVIVDGYSYNPYVLKESITTALRLE